MAPAAPFVIRVAAILAAISVAVAGFSIALVTTAPAREPGSQSRMSDLVRRAIEQRATEAAIWGMPAVNYDLMLQEMLTKTPGKVGQVIYWGRPLDWKNQTLTPNPDALYFMVFVNTKDGPVVLDLPPGDANGSFNANIVTAWQVPLEDAGLLGFDKGNGGKYLILPPGYAGPKPQGYIPLQSDTYGGYMLFRANLKSHSEADVARSVAYGKRMKIYPLAQAANPAATVFTDVKDVTFDSTIRYDASFFANLDRIVQSEPWLARDRAMIDQLRSLGIEKGKPYSPDEATTMALETGIREVHALLEAKYDAGMPPFFSETSRWMFPVPPDLIKAMQSGFADLDNYPVDDRGMVYSYAFIGIKRLGAGQFYSISIRDKNGDAFDGGNTYRLNVPPNAPVEQYWSVTAYDRETHALIKGMPRASRASNASDVQKNADGSVDIYFGPRAPEGKDSNWVPTDPARRFELMARFYGPKKEFFDKVWKLPDVELVSQAQAQARSQSTRGQPVPTLAQAQEVPTPKSAADVPGTPPGTVMTKDYVAMVGRMAYVWGWPLVNHYNRAAAVEKLPEPGRIGGVMPASPPGYISMLTDYIDEGQRFVTCPNQDTVYGAGYQRLDTKPVIVQVPDFGDRFYTYQIADARTQSIAALGKQYGTKPGFYLLVGPNWKGEVPKGINAVIRSSTDVTVIFPRVFQDDTPEDKRAIQPLLSKVVVYPLSEFDGKMKTKDWKATSAFPAPAGQGAGETKWVVPERFFDQLPAVMQAVPPLPGEEAHYGMIKSVLDAADKDPEIKATLQQTAVAAEEELIKPLFEFRNNGRPVGNGWTSPPNGARWGTDYLSRAATARSNMYDNAPEETRYIYTDFDSTGRRLNGANRYTVTFAKGEIPPVNGFWSLTLYNKQHFFEPNPLNRYSLGTKSKSLRYNADGSLTLYFQNESPGADKESNWVPAPKDEFSLYIRAKGAM
jgi:hypothetical protein